MQFTPGPPLERGCRDGGCPKGEYCLYLSCHPWVQKKKVKQVSFQECLGEKFDLKPYERPENVEIVTFPTEYPPKDR